MSLTLAQIFASNPITTNNATDLMYFSRSPYSAGFDRAMTYANFAAQFGAPYTPAALTEVNDTNVTMTLGGSPSVALLNATSMTLGWSGQLSLGRGGTNANLSPSNNGLVYSTASALAILGTANNGVLATSSGGVPSITSTLPAAVQLNITQLGAQAQALNMGGFQINGLATPTASTDATTKGYVDNLVAGLNPIPGVQAASTVSLTVTYLNGVSGVGATLTNAGAQAAFVIDTYTASVGDRILIKNQASSLQNGIYVVTSVGSGSTNWVLTRSSDYNTPGAINVGDLVAVQQGGQMGSSWIESSVVTTIGTDPITFGVFFSPSNFVSSTLSAGKIYVGNASNVAVGVSMSGDATLSNAGALTLGANVVTNAKAAQMAANTIKGNNTAGTANAVDLTVAQAKTLLGFASSGVNADITSMTGLTGYLQAPIGIKDSSGNVIVNFNTVASAVNFLSLNATATGAAPTIGVGGSDAAIGLVFSVKNGFFSLTDSTNTSAPVMRFYNSANTFFSGLQAGTLAASTTWKLPTADAAGVMQSDGSGNLSLGALDLTSTKATATFTDISGTVSVTGFSGTPTVTIRQCVIGKIVHLNFNITGTSNATTFTVTGLPKTSNIAALIPLFITNNGANAIGSAQFTASSTTMAILVAPTAGAFTASGTKAAQGSLFYEST